MAIELGGEDVTVVDVDAHYIDVFGDLVEYIDDEAWVERALAGTKSQQTPGSLKGFWPKITSADESFRDTGFTGPPGTGHWDIEQETMADAELADTQAGVLGTMEYLNIDKIVLLGNQMITFDQMKGDDRRPIIYANAYVDYMLDNIVSPKHGIYTMAPMPTNDPEAAAALIDRVGDEDGVAGAVFITSKIEPPLGNRRYEVIYDAAQKKDLPVVFHGGTPGLDNFYINGYTRRLSTHALGFLFANMSQITSLIVQGIPEKFPDLKIVFQESGIFWIPMMMFRLDSEYLRRPHQAPLLEKPPSDYMKEMWYGTQPLDQPTSPKYFADAIDMLGGADQLLYTSDWPHHDWDDTNAITSLPISTEDKIKILGENAEEVFGI